ncbi:MAG TPA: PPE domain-containing protein [Mycobacterium sp.]
MSFAALPPEINSGLMYTGPGSGSILAAATAWDGLAAEAHALAAVYESVVQELTSASWLGPSSVAMASTAAPYIMWLNATAAQAEKTAAQAKTAAAAYATAHAMIVPPWVVAANRAQLIKLVATNVLGQNTPAIAAIDAQYLEMWAQDGAVMDGYWSSAATAADVSPFAPLQRANPSGPAGQTAAAGQAAGNSVAANTQTALSQAAPVVSAQAAVPAPPVQAGIEDFFALPGLADIIGADVTSSIGIGVSGGAWSSASEGTEAILSEQGQLKDVSAQILGAIDLYSPLTPSRPGSYVPVPLPAAGLGQAASVGSLSVPSSWTMAAPEIRAAAYTLPIGGGGSPGIAAGMGTAFSEMSLAGMGGSALAGSVGKGRQEPAGGGTRARVTLAQSAAAPRSPAQPKQPVAPQQPADVPATGIAAEIREFAELRDAGLLTDEEFQLQKRRLLGL